MIDCGATDSGNRNAFFERSDEYFAFQFPSSFVTRNDSSIYRATLNRNLPRFDESKTNEGKTRSILKYC